MIRVMIFCLVCASLTCVSTGCGGKPSVSETTPMSETDFKAKEKEQQEMVEKMKGMSSSSK